MIYLTVNPNDAPHPRVGGQDWVGCLRRMKRQCATECLNSRPQNAEVVILLTHGYRQPYVDGIAPVICVIITNSTDGNIWPELKSDEK